MIDMLAIWTWIVKSITSFNVLTFFGGFNILSGKVWGKVIYISLICFGVLLLWNKFTAPTYETSNDVKIEKVENYHAVPVKKTNDWFVLTLFNMKFGFTTEQK